MEEVQCERKRLARMSTATAVVPVTTHPLVDTPTDLVIATTTNGSLDRTPVLLPPLPHVATIAPDALVLVPPPRPRVVAVMRADKAAAATVTRTTTGTDEREGDVIATPMIATESTGEEQTMVTADVAARPYPPLPLSRKPHRPWKGRGKKGRRGRMERTPSLPFRPGCRGSSTTSHGSNSPQLNRRPPPPPPPPPLPPPPPHPPPLHPLPPLPPSPLPLLPPQLSLKSSTHQFT